MAGVPLHTQACCAVLYKQRCDNKVMLIGTSPSTSLGVPDKTAVPCAEKEEGDMTGDDILERVSGALLEQTGMDLDEARVANGYREEVHLEVLQEATTFAFVEMPAMQLALGDSGRGLIRPSCFRLGSSRR